MKGLDQLKFLRRNYCILKRERECACDIIEKELKALEIIKDKKVDVWCFTRDCKNLTYKQFLQSRGLDAITSYTSLTQEEYNLLKEVLL